MTILTTVLACGRVDINGLTGCCALHVALPISRQEVPTGATTRLDLRSSLQGIVSCLVA